jgi:hypothetical protein
VQDHVIKNRREYNDQDVAQANDKDGLCAVAQECDERSGWDFSLDEAAKILDLTMSELRLLKDVKRMVLEKARIGPGLRKAGSERRV